MAMVEISVKWVEFQDELNGRCIELSDINDFCNIYASSYEEYMTIWELLADEMGL